MPRRREGETPTEWRTCEVFRFLQTLARVNFVIAMTGEYGIVKLRMPERPARRGLDGAR